MRRRFIVGYSAAVGEDPTGSRITPADNPIMRVSRTTLVVGTIIFCLARSAGSEPRFPVVSGSELRNHRLSHIRGMSVENQDGETLGTVKNFIADMEAGEIKYGLVASGGLLGVRSKMRVVPARALSTATAKKRTVALNVPKSRWKNAPIFKQRDLVLLNNPDRARQIYQFYAQAAGTKIGPLKQPLTPPTPTDGEAGATKRLAGRKGSLQLTSDLIGRNVTNQQQQNLGEVSDLLIDLTGQKPAFAIFSGGRFSKKGEGYAVQLRSLSLTADGKIFLEANPSRFDQARSFNPSQWQAAGASATNEVFRNDDSDHVQNQIEIKHK